MLVNKIELSSKVQYERAKHNSFFEEYSLTNKLLWVQSLCQLKGCEINTKYTNQSYVIMIKRHVWLCCVFEISELLWLIYVSWSRYDVFTVTQLYNRKGLVNKYGNRRMDKLVLYVFKSKFQWLTTSVDRLADFFCLNFDSLTVLKQLDQIYWNMLCLAEILIWVLSSGHFVSFSSVLGMFLENVKYGQWSLKSHVRSVNCLA